MELFEPLSEFM